MLDNAFAENGVWYPLRDKPDGYDIPESPQTAELAPFIVLGAEACVLVIPGGGYFQLSVESEGTSVAAEYNKAGISAFVLRHRIKPYDGRAILADGQLAMITVRKLSTRFGYKPDKIAVCGFSAGGHLAVMLCQHTVTAGVSSKPDACILGYAVTTLGDGTFRTMPPIFLGGRTDEAGKYSFGYDTGAMPPTFIWYSQLDGSVDYIKNSVALYDSLQAGRIPCECHGFSDGGHGIGLGRSYRQCSQWHGLSVEFLKKHGF